MAAFIRQKRRRGWLRELALPVLFFAAVLLLLWQGLGGVSRAAAAEELRGAEQAVRRAAVQCYALEGRYPESLEYLEQNYGLVVDHSRYVVHYQGVGANLMPQIGVFPAGGGAGPDE